MVFRALRDIEEAAYLKKKNGWLPAPFNGRVVMGKDGKRVCPRTVLCEALALRTLDNPFVPYEGDDECDFPWYFFALRTTPTSFTILKARTGCKRLLSRLFPSKLLDQEMVGPLCAVDGTGHPIVDLCGLYADLYVIAKGLHPAASIWCGALARGGMPQAGREVNPDDSVWTHMHMPSVRATDEMLDAFFLQPSVLRLRRMAILRSCMRVAFVFLALQRSVREKRNAPGGAGLKRSRERYES